MKNRWIRGGATVLLLCAVLCAFYVRESMRPEYMEIPITRVLAYVAAPTASPTPCERYRTQRETQRSEEMASLTALAQAGDEAASALLHTLVAQAEMETAVESALAAMGYATAICAVREGAVTICVDEKLSDQQAQALIEMCEKITEECAENVFILDECGYS